jgi:tetratricopeptide (TPR) repeat protein
LFEIIALSVLLAASQLPNSDAAWLEQARRAYQNAQFSEARRAAQNATELNPRASAAELILGLIDLRESNLEKAREHLSRVIELSPENVSAHYNLGVIDLLQKRPASALPHFAAVRRSNTADVPALVGILECQIALNDTVQVAETAKSLSSLIGTEAAMLSKVAGILVTGGHYGPAIPLLRRLRDAEPKSFEPAYNLSLAYFRTDKLREAASALAPWTGSQPNAQALNMLGAIYEKENRYGEAMRAFEQAAGLAPSNEDFRIDHASVLVETGHLNEAAAVFAGAVRDFPNSVRANLGLGSAYYLAGKYDLAARALLGAVRVRPDFPTLYALLGRTFESVPAMQDEIRRTFAAYLQRGPRDAEAYARYGEMLFAAGDSSEAKRNVMRALEIDPRLAEGHLQLGTMLQREGDLAGAAKSLERAVDLAPDQAAAHYRLATVYHKLGRTLDGQRELEQFQKLKVQEATRERELVVRAMSAGK